MMEPETSAGLCQCGCGQKTNLAPKTNNLKGWVKGQPLRFVSGHNALKVRHRHSTLDQKRCTKCKKDKLQDAFYRSSNSSDGRHSWCKQCLDTAKNAVKTRDPRRYRAMQRASWYRNRLNLEQDGYDAMLQEQQGVCKVCKCPETTKNKDGLTLPLSVDHDHTTGKVRGLLCRKCNIGIGSFGDSPDLLIRAAEYLSANR
jgi:hypothetical protein